MNFSTDIHFEFLQGFNYIFLVCFPISKNQVFSRILFSELHIELRDSFAGVLWKNRSEISEISPEKY